jgi:hypothetical protein
MSTTAATATTSIQSVQYRVRLSSHQPPTPARTLRFEERSIVLLELKRRICYDQQWIPRVEEANVDVHVVNSDTGEEYRDDAHSIRANTSLTVRKLVTTHDKSSRLWMPVGSVPPHLANTDPLPADVSLATPTPQTLSNLVPPPAHSLSSTSFSSSSATKNTPLTPFERIVADRALEPVVPGTSIFAIVAPQVRSSLSHHHQHQHQHRPYSRPPPQCHRCHKTGHLIAQCLMMPASASLPPPPPSRKRSAQDSSSSSSSSSPHSPELAASTAACSPPSKKMTL